MVVQLRRAPFAVLQAAVGVAVIFVGLVKSAEFHFTIMRNSRVAPSATEETTTVFAANLGHCCALCSVSSSCKMVSYVKSMSSCQLLVTSNASNVTLYSDSTSVLLIKVDLIENVVPVTASLQSVTGALVQSGQAEGYTSYSVQNVINAAHCWRLCTALTCGRCQLFAHHASLLSCLVYNVDFYDSWTTVSSNDTSWTSYYAKRTDGWKLLYKISKGIGVDALGVLFSGPTSTTGSGAQMAMNANCACYLRNGIVDTWSKFPITSVSFVLATGGRMMKFVNFSTTSTDTASTFFTVSKITSSSWTDLTAATSVLYMQTGSSYGRYFLVVKSYGGCNNDSGWITVNGQGTESCTYDLRPVPQFAYASGTTVAYLSASTFADALLLYVKM